MSLSDTLQMSSPYDLYFFASWRQREEALSSSMLFSW